MNATRYLTLQFVKDIKKSNEYNQYHRLRAKLMKDNELYTKINELRRRNFEVQIKTDIDAYEESNVLRTEYEELFNNLIVNEFLIAEQRLCKMMREINNIITEALDMDLDFLD